MVSLDLVLIDPSTGEGRGVNWKAITNSTPSWSLLLINPLIQPIRFFYVNTVLKGLIIDKDVFYNNNGILKAAVESGVTSLTVTEFFCHSTLT